MNKKLLIEIEKYKKKRDMDLVLESNWINKFLLLMDFKKQFGHTNVPAKYSSNKTLGHWVRWQRSAFRMNRLDPLREYLLSIAGFEFRLLKIHDWHAMYRKVTAFKKKFGHTRITESCGDLQLYNWLTYQRKLYWRERIERSKLNQLKELGVEMKNKTANSWNEKYQRLVYFKKAHGHLYVCRHYQADDQLINFVKVIRRSKDKISDERRLLLDKIGFVWEPGKKLSVFLNKKRANKAQVRTTPFR